MLQLNHVYVLNTTKRLLEVSDQSPFPQAVATRTFRAKRMQIEQVLSSIVVPNCQYAFRRKNRRWRDGATATTDGYRDA